MPVMDDLRRLLDYLEGTVDAAAQERIAQRHRAALEWRAVDRPPLICTFPHPPEAPFQPVPHRRIFDDPAAMLYNELVRAFDTSLCLADQVGHDLPWTVRPNFGTVVVASLFGGRIEQRGDDPPWVRPFETVEQFRRALDRDPSDVSEATVDRARRGYQFYAEALGPYPGLCAAIRFVLPDLQGPFDTAEQLRGSEIFTDLYTQPDLVALALERIAAVQVRLAQHLQAFLREPLDGFTHQHGTLIRGHILLRDDTVIMVSPEMYRDHIARWDDFVLDRLGGGGIHACGRFDGHVEAFLALPNVQCLDLGQSWLNDVDAMYEKACQRSIPLVRVRTDEQQLVSGEIVHRFPTGATFIHDAPTWKDARRVCMAYRDRVEVS
ncbi:MAG TPA: hypothetical protein ENN87_00630 [Phycisphaerales bacterium]|nr:hypothetical protein [Phycisphaerales bacterium]